MIDHTKQKELPICPKCGRHGEKHEYKNEDFNSYVHKKKETMGFWEVTDNCIVNKEEE